MTDRSRSGPVETAVPVDGTAYSPKYLAWQIAEDHTWEAKKMYTGPE
jgi:hypothetical protein